MKHLNIAYILFCVATLTLATWKVHASPSLTEILSLQTDEHKARHSSRNPKETLEFFNIKPGMTVIEAFPGGGWYSKVLLPFLGKNGKLIGVNYNDAMWGLFEGMPQDFIDQQLAWDETFPDTAKSWGLKNSASVEAYTFSTLPKNKKETVDAVLFIRALHNLHRFETQGKYFSNALKTSYELLKPNGIVGVVQHESADTQIDGSTGYLNKKALIKKFEKAGFKFIAESAINQNPKDKADDIVWRLPPSMYTTKEGDPKREEYKAIGESNRMTLLFHKI